LALGIVVPPFDGTGVWLAFGISAGWAAAAVSASAKVAPARRIFICVSCSAGNAVRARGIRRFRRFS
jgi:hypothetical protein